jgi:hypothetical protein
VVGVIEMIKPNCTKQLHTFCLQRADANQHESKITFPYHNHDQSKRGLSQTLDKIKAKAKQDIAAPSNKHGYSN